MKPLKIIAPVMLLALFTGCSLREAIPYTAITGDLNKGTFSIHAPKDGDLEGLDISRATNGDFHLHVDKHVVRMNPDVVTAAAAGQAQIISATAAAVQSASTAAAAGAAAAIKASAGVP